MVQRAEKLLTSDALSECKLSLEDKDQLVQCCLFVCGEAQLARRGSNLRSECSVVCVGQFLHL
jgi:hypothetical protein